MAAFQALNPSLDICPGSVFWDILWKWRGVRKVVELGGWLGFGGRYSFHACCGIGVRNCLWMSNGSYWQHWSALCFSSWDLGGPVCGGVWHSTMSYMMPLAYLLSCRNEKKSKSIPSTGASRQFWKWTCCCQTQKSTGIGMKQLGHVSVPLSECLFGSHFGKVLISSNALSLTSSLSYFWLPTVTQLLHNDIMNTFTLPTCATPSNIPKCTGNKLHLGWETQRVFYEWWLMLGNVKLVIITVPLQHLIKLAFHESYLFEFRICYAPTPILTFA
jgi:hypothetical protein